MLGRALESHWPWNYGVWIKLPRFQGLAGGASGKEPTCQCRRCKRGGFDPWVRKIPWLNRKWQPIPVFLLGESHGQRSLAGSVQFSSVAQLCQILCSPMDYSTPGFPVHHQLLEFTQIHVHWVGDAIQLSHPLLSPSPPGFNLPQHQSVFQWVSSQVAKDLEFQLQHQTFQWIFRTDFL